MITTESMRNPCSCRSVGECYCNFGVGQKALDKMVACFSMEMKRKLKRKYLEGYHGWDDPENFPDEGIVEALKEHVNKGNWVDVANFAAMLWNRRS